MLSPPRVAFWLMWIRCRVFGQGGRDDETRDAVMAEAKEPAASAPDVKPEPQKEEAKSSKTTGEEGKAPGRDGNGKGSCKDAAAEGKTLKERSLSVEGKAGTGAGAGAGAVKPKAKDSRDARPAPPKEKTSGNSDNMQLSGVKRERYVRAGAAVLCCALHCARRGGGVHRHTAVSHRLTRRVSTSTRTMPARSGGSAAHLSPRPPRRYAGPDTHPHVAMRSQ
jgi:hypothetical protein